MKTVFYTTIENQVREDGTHGLLYDHFDNEAQAYAKFFTICAAAAVSDIPFHEALLIHSEYGAVERRKWDRREDTAATPTEE